MLPQVSNLKCQPILQTHYFFIEPIFLYDFFFVVMWRNVIWKLINLCEKKLNPR